MIDLCRQRAEDGFGVVTRPRTGSRWASWSRRTAALGFAMLLLASPGLGQTRGYTARSCSFDLDDDGVVGERFEDCQLCDGVTSDPDGDGISEDLLYVDASVGSDTSGNGSPGNPFRTIMHAWSVADGGGDGAEDIVCFRGVASESYLSPPAGYTGVPGIHTVPASGSEKRAWQYPRDPAMLVGWDADGDGCYPPYDDGARDVARCGTTADIAVLDGSSPSAQWAFRFEIDVSHLELAHLELRDYGRFSTTNDSGFVNFGRSYDPGHEYLYLHDLEVHRINMARFDSAVITFNFFNTNMHWAKFSNLLFTDNGSWFVRGVPHNGDSGRPDLGPVRWQNITRVMLGPDAGASPGSTPGFKVWGHTSQVEILDSIWDTNVAGGAWNPTRGGGWGNKAFMVRPCSQDWLIRNNEVLDSFISMTVDGSKSGSCENEFARPVDNVVIDRNIFTNTWSGWSTFGHKAISIDGGEAGGTEGDWAGEVVGNVTITNNLMSSTIGWDACVQALPGNDVAPPPGQVIIAHNTCVAKISRSSVGMITIGKDADNQPQMNFMQQNFVIKNNIIDGLNDRDKNLFVAYLPSGLDSDSNVYDGLGKYVLQDGGTTHEVSSLSEWQNVSGEDATSKECNPLYADPGAGDYRLNVGDTCAKDSGVDLSAITTVDVDGQPRPQGNRWDIGADEVGGILSDGFETGDLSRWTAAVY